MKKEGVRVEVFEKTAELVVSAHAAWQRNEHRESGLIRACTQTARCGDREIDGDTGRFIEEAATLDRDCLRLCR